VVGEHDRDVVGRADPLELGPELDERVQLGPALAQRPFVDRRAHRRSGREEQQADRSEDGVAIAPRRAIAQELGVGGGVAEEQQQRVPHRELEARAVRHDQCHGDDIEEHEREDPAVGAAGQRDGKREEHTVEQQHP
jgi:hypothetical protein